MFSTPRLRRQPQPVEHRVRDPEERPALRGIDWGEEQGIDPARIQSRSRRLLPSIGISVSIQFSEPDMKRFAEAMRAAQPPRWGLPPAPWGRPRRRRRSRRA